MTNKPRALLLVTADLEPKYDREFNTWYNQEHVPERLACPGFLTARRFVAVEAGQPRYLALYDLESLDTLSTPAYRHALENPTERTQRFMGRYTEGIPGDIPIDMRRMVYSEIPISR